MHPDRAQRCLEIFKGASEQPPAERSGYLDSICAGDDALRRKVELLLKYHEQSSGFIEAPAFEVVPELLLDDADALIGQRLGHYRIDAVLGLGGMGVVYLACDEQLGRKVGLKLLPQSLVADQRQLERLQHEARTASALNHPNIVTIHQIGEVGGVHYIATEYIEGVTLRERMRHGPVPLHEALEIVEQVASALEVAHAAGIVHRDIKPENIMLRPDGYVKVLDFGIAKFTQQNPAAGRAAAGPQVTTQPGVILGTTRYMSPEQARGLPVDARSDIWSLGVVLYELVGGIEPFPGETPSDCIASILKTEPPPLAQRSPLVPSGLEAVVLKALRKDAGERYQDVSEMLAALRHLEPNDSSTQPAPHHEPIRRGNKTPVLALAAVVCVAAAIIYGLRFRTPTTPASVQKSIAVLPFADLSQARDQEYLCDGIQDEILTRLSKVADLKVISRTSTRRFKSAPANLPEIAKQLGVAHVLEGTVQKSGDQMRVSVRLINARKEAPLWAENYDRSLTDIFAVESEVATKIASALQAKLTGAEERAISSRPTANSQAHQAYLKGLYYWSKFPAPDFGKSRDYFQQAITIDPSYAVAHAGLASYYARASANGVMPPGDGWPKCEAEVDRALELDEALAEAYHPRAILRLYNQRDWPGAEHDLRRGIGLNPNWAEIRVFYALCLAAFGRDGDALAEIEHAVELEPASARVNTTRARILFAVGQEDAAIAQCRSAIELDPNYPRIHDWLGHFYEKKKMYREAIGEWSKAARLRGEVEVASMIEQTYSASGFDGTVRALAERQLAQLNEKAAQGEYVPAAEYVLAYTRAGEKGEAFTWLAKAVEERNWFVYELRLDPRFGPIRNDPRFEHMVSAVVRPST